MNLHAAERWDYYSEDDKLNSIYFYGGTLTLTMPHAAHLFRVLYV